MSEKVLEPHYEILSCYHQNNLKLKYEDDSMNTPGVCPKGCKDPTVTARYDIYVQVAET